MGDAAPADVSTADADVPTDAKDKKEWKTIHWVIIAVLIAAVIFIFGPMIMKMFNNKVGQSFGEQAIGQELAGQTVTQLLSNT
jgi:hypothetical protein